MKKLTAIFTSLLLLIFSCVGCTQEGKTLVKINEVTHSVFYAPLYLADALGYFAEENIVIELTNGGGADNTMAALLSGSADVAFCGPEAALYVKLGESTDSPTVFGQLTKRDGSFLVSRRYEPNFRWTDLAGKEILAGRVGGVPAMTFEYVLNKHGLFNGENVSLNFDVAFNLMTSAFESGVADYCTMFEPVATEYQRAGKGYIVASVGEESGEIPYTCFIAKPSWLNENKTVATRFLTAVTRAVKYVNEHSADECAALLLPYFEATAQSSLAAAIRSYRSIDAWMTNLAMQEQSFINLQNVIENAGELSRRVSFDELILTEYAQTAYNSVYA